MNITVEQSIDATIYVENVYQGSLSESDLLEVRSIPWVHWFEDWLQLLSSTDTKLAKSCELSLRLTSDRQIQAFNHQYRSLDNPTDVLAFAACEANITLPIDIAEPVYLGDIIISLDTAARQAIEQQHSFTTELAWLASHGLLHLIGWDHPDESSLQKMLQQQSELIQLIIF
ncbi:MAG: rRNA maturation RNase YbeY [Pleurocapsa sp.]